MLKLLRIRKARSEKLRDRVEQAVECFDQLNCEVDQLVEELREAKIVQIRRPRNRTG